MSEEHVDKRKFGVNIEIRCEECEHTLSEGNRLVCEKCYATLKTAHDELESRVEELKSELEDKEEQYNELEEKYDELEEKYDELEERYNSPVHKFGRGEYKIKEDG